MVQDKRFPLTTRYDPSWVCKNSLGPHPLWLVEWLTQKMVMHPGMRILDLGCGKALTSIFLALEYSSLVFAYDLEIKPEDNFIRISESGLQDKVFPIMGEAHTLPFGAGFFDAIVAVNNYHYYATESTDLPYFLKFLRPGGEIGIVMPGLFQELGQAIPSHLAESQSSGDAFWQPEHESLHSAEWWGTLWSECPGIELIACGAMSDGGNLWLKWEQGLALAGSENRNPANLEALKKDKNTNLTLIRLVGRKTI